jgi:hypothetical protein
MFIMRSPARKFQGDGEEWNVGMRSYEFFKNDVNAAINAGALKASDPEIATFSLWSHAHGIVSLMLRNRCPMWTPDELPAVAKKALNVVLDNISVTA